MNTIPDKWTCSFCGKIDSYMPQLEDNWGPRGWIEIQLSDTNSDGGGAYTFCSPTCFISEIIRYYGLGR
jgi:hypothetical protein